MIFLDTIIRQKDVDFQNMLNEVRIGSISENTKKILLSRLKRFDNKFKIVYFHERINKLI